MSEEKGESKRRRAAARAAVRGPSSARREGGEPTSDKSVENAGDRGGKRVATRARAAARSAEKRDREPQAQEPGPAAREPEAKPAMSPSPPPASAPSAQAIERDLLGLLRDIDDVQEDPDARRRAADAIARIAARLYPEAQPTPNDEALLGTARQLLSTSYYIRQWSRLGMRGRSEQVDDFGLDPTYEARIQPLLDALYKNYFRVELQGAENIPEQGGCLLVCNHSGTLPWDGVMLKTALRHALPSRRSLRWLTDDFVFHSPFLGAWLNRIGAVRACPENAQRLLERGEMLAVFPEGVKGIGKPYRERYQLQRFGRGGHVKLALRLGVPLIPVAIVGAEETYPLLHKVRAFSKVLGMPFVPITPLFPWLGPLGLVPLPSRWQLRIGPPMKELEAHEGSSGDTVVINELNEQLRGQVQTLLQQALKARTSVWL